ncbi:hypothetical protein RDI58_002074 [Solanum bulbocastanum]|uniref:Glutamyl-tRNA reductase n=1 Tax=Solanum bulbocastanum TaxID=147425 RepID=A0AAN8UCU7_SOLBU
MASCFATSLAVAETGRCSFNCEYSSSVHCFRDQVRYFGRSRGRIKPLVYPYSSIPRCEVSVVEKESNVSGLEVLKTSDRYINMSSNIMVIGLNIHTAPVELREKVSIPESEWPQAILELCSLNHIEEAAVLSTCNRIEIYVVALSKNHGIKEVTEWMCKYSGVSVTELREHQFLLYNKDATQHLFEVAAGLDSLVLGEGQILAQVKQVVKNGQGERVPGFGRKISELFKHAITAGKRVRTETNISSGSVSVSSAAVELALLKHIPDSSSMSPRVLIVGAGKMGKLVIRHLIAKGCKEMVVVNRTEDRVAAIREELNTDDAGVIIEYKPFSEMLSCTAQADVIFTCTASKDPLFVKESVQAALRCVNSSLSRLFIDISVPRNVESRVSELEGACIYNVDNLNEVVEANKEDRLRKKKEAEVIIAEEVKKFEALKDSLETVPTIKKLRACAERIRAAEVEKCLSKIGDDDLSENNKKAIYDLSLVIVNKMLHGPMQHLKCCETPLHISCSSGHLEFSKEIIHLMPEFVRELNQDGFSPLHIASANGDIEIVKELLSVDYNLCLLKGKDRRISLHYAVIKGREHVMKELLVASPDSAEEVTARGETCLHLAVKNHQFERFKLLLENLKEFNMYDILNKKDIQGNTVLHLAVSTKQYEVVDILLDENVVSKGTIEMNSLNKGGLTPLEVLLKESGDRDIEEILRTSGAVSAEPLQSSQQEGLPQSWVVPVQDPSNEQSSREQTRDDWPRSNSKKLQDFFKYNKTKDPPGKVRDTLLVIAILIATSTYQTVLSPPGGVWQDTYLPEGNKSNNNDVNMESSRCIAGQSVMGTNNPISYGLFLVFNSIGFFVSLHTINFLTIGFPLQLELQV